MLHRRGVSPAGLLIPFFLFFCGLKAGIALYVREGGVGVAAGWRGVMARGVGDQRSSARRSRGEGASGWGVRVWLRGGEERGRAGQGISGRRLVEVRDRVGGKGSRRRGSVVQGVWGQSSPSCLKRAGLSRGAGQRDAATFTLPYVFVSPPSGCSILSSLSCLGGAAGCGCEVRCECACLSATV